MAYPTTLTLNGSISIIIYHTHHIIPKHAGGTDDPSNLIQLTVEEHAEAHRKLWEEHGHRGDYLAWKALSGQIGKEEILYERSILGASQPGEKNGMWGRTHSDEQKAKWSKERKGVKLSEEHKRNMSKAQQKNPNPGRGFKRRVSCVRCRMETSVASMSHHWKADKCTTYS